MAFISEMSHPTMGAWIEIDQMFFEIMPFTCRTPRWVRGLKLVASSLAFELSLSHPTMGAWIEIFKRNYARA